jgi:hypothetical protein
VMIAPEWKRRLRLGLPPSVVRAYTQRDPGIDVYDQYETMNFWWRHGIEPWLEKAEEPYAAVQSVLLRQDWLTWERLRAVQWRHLLSFAERELRAFLVGGSSDEVRAQCVMLERSLRSNFEWGSVSPLFIQPNWRREESSRIYYPSWYSTYNHLDLPHVFRNVPCRGTVIHVVGTPISGYVLEFKRNYECSTSRSLQQVVLLGSVNEEHVYDPPYADFRLDSTPRSTMEREATAVPPPRGNQDVRAPVDGVSIP